jgi:hypothetical protein
MTNKPREIFTAQFDRYDFDRRFKRIYFNNIKNDKGVLIKERFWISKKKGKEHNLIDNMFEGEVIFFSAIIEMRAKYEDGFKLICPIVLIQKK